MTRTWLVHGERLVDSTPRPRNVEFVLSTQPLIGNADYPHDLCLATGAELTGEPEADEAAEVRWVPLSDAQVMIASGEIAGAMTVIGVQHALLRRQSLADPAGKSLP